MYDVTLTDYKDAVKCQVEKCSDVSLLDLIFKLLIKSQGEEIGHDGKEEL